MHIVDLKGQKGVARVSGHYTAPVRVINASGVLLDCSNLSVSVPPSEEDAIKIAEPEHLEIINYTGEGAISVIGEIGYLKVRKCFITNGKYGVRATQHNGEPYGRIFIHDCIIKDVGLEGIYIGKSRPIKARVDYIEVMGCTVMGSGWDPIQVGNAKNALIRNCVAIDGARAKTFGQDGYIVNNNCDLLKIVDCDIRGPIHCLGGRTFVYS